MRWIVLGSTGMFGMDMERALIDAGESVVGLNRANFDFNSPDREYCRYFENADVVVNAIAYTAVDMAESDPTTAFEVNGHMAGRFATIAKQTESKFIHISTDYVFDGDAGEAYSVFQTVNPKSAYGASKALGEELVQLSGAEYSILRTAWLYGAGGRCFPKIIGDVLDTRGTVKVVSDQFGQPTWTRDLAEQVLAYSLIEKAPKIIHAVASGKASWSDFAIEVANSLGIMGEDAVTSITTSEYPTPARRPAWSVLDNSSDLVEPIGHWRERWLVAADEVLGSR